MNYLSKRVAILGATGHVAKGLIYEFSKSNQYSLFLFARSTERLKSFLGSIKFINNVCILRFEEFDKQKYDVIINCIGVGDPGKLSNAGTELIKITEIYDNMILDYLQKHPDTLYINFSSGAVYGEEFDNPVDDSSYAVININNISIGGFYQISKINSEAKHRSMKSYNIVDLRIFSYFSRFIDLESKFFLCEVIRCLRNRVDFFTGNTNIIRDYVGMKDLLLMIQKCVDKHKINDVFDVYSKKPVSKLEILDFFRVNYGLGVVFDKSSDSTAVTGNKYKYYSNSRKAEKIGYMPKLSSMDSIVYETKKYLRQKV